MPSAWERDTFLIASRTGNLTFRVVGAGTDLHQRSAQQSEYHFTAPRLIVGADLCDDTDARTASAGRALIETVLVEW